MLTFSNFRLSHAQVYKKMEAFKKAEKKNEELFKLN